MIQFILFMGLCAVLLYLIYRNWTSLDRKHKDVAKGIIHIIVDNKPLNKAPATDEHEIVKEAEAMFKTLQKKYLYSPVPYKVLGDFYMQKGIYSRAIEKYQQMIRYLNADLDLNKLASVITFLTEQGQAETVDQINAYYQEVR